MIKYFDIVKHKTNIKGFWQNSEGKLYIDNIHIRQSKALNRKIKHYLFTEKNQEALFYLDNGKAFILSKEGKGEALKTNIKLCLKHIKPSFFKALLRDYKGFTVYKRRKSFVFDIWQA